MRRQVKVLPAFFVFVKTFFKVTNMERIVPAGEYKNAGLKSVQI